jgi:DNA-directed RNA polymerase I, II, and III subunit RPABC2|tara:strand:- start:226 stop:786 length:561 start_codon:yes stop_codon:yes gene_type:complete
MFGLYNGIFDMNCLSKSKIKEIPKKIQNINEELPEPVSEEPSVIEGDEDISADASLQKAIDHYRKIKEADHELSESELTALDKNCEVIRNRQIIVNDTQHTAVELVNDSKILMGPPGLTRFEKARIMGARALQLSLGAPPFVDIPKNATTSLQIAMEELEQRVIPISIRRVQPNGDFQNIPLSNFN